MAEIFKGTAIFPARSSLRLARQAATRIDPGGYLGLSNNVIAFHNKEFGLDMAGSGTHSVKSGNKRRGVPLIARYAFAYFSDAETLFRSLL